MGKFVNVGTEKRVIVIEPLRDRDKETLAIVRHNPNLHFAASVDRQRITITIKHEIELPKKQ